MDGVKKIGLQSCETQILLDIIEPEIWQLQQSTIGYHVSFLTILNGFSTQQSICNTSVYSSAAKPFARSNDWDMHFACEYEDRQAKSEFFHRCVFFHIC
jgi:hypothetical protein